MFKDCFWGLAKARLPINRKWRLQSHLDYFLGGAEASTSKKAFTMVELILTIVIMGILASGSYVALSALYTKSAKTKAISELSFDTTLISNQISALLANRVPATVIGSQRDDKFESIYDLNTSYNTLEWIGIDYELYMEGKYSGFVDFNLSDKNQNMIFSPNTKDINGSALIFAGSFDEGSVVYGGDFNNSFGWYNDKNHTKIFKINATDKAGKLYLSSHPETIYEKYYLLKSAYAIVKYDENLSTHVDSLYQDENNLLLFYNYYPWKGQKFWDGNVTILSNEAKGFEIDFVDGSLQFNLTLERTVRKRGKDIKVQISKQKVVF